jgi:electron transfer flavoprotein alpha subunit
MAATGAGAVRAEILVVAEHRDREFRDITMQMLNKAADLSRAHGFELSAVVLGSGVTSLAETLADRAGRVIVYDDPRLQHFDPDLHKEILAALLAERKPLLTLLGHTPWSLDLAPALAVKTGYPLATDCVDILVDTAAAAPPVPKVVRQVYGGKMFARMAFREAAGYLVTVRGGAFPAAQAGEYQAEIVQAPLPPGLTDTAGSAATAAAPGGGRREFLGYVDTCKGEVDIAQAELLVSIGRGIGEEDNIASAKELAELLGGTLSCSRPVVDKKWLPKCHQVGTSGKSVKPKVYLALGISGAFQHVAGMSGAGTVIAVNKDRKAPIFRVADYGVVADLLPILAALKERLPKD